MLDEFQRDVIHRLARIETRVHDANLTAEQSRKDTAEVRKDVEARLRGLERTHQKTIGIMAILMLPATAAVHWLWGLVTKA